MNQSTEPTRPAGGRSGGLSGGFAASAWAAVAERYADIVAHPFVVGLGDGTLPQEVFVRYLVDDAHYLLSYARVLASVGSRMPSADGVAELAGSAVGAITAERGLHRGFLAPLGIDPDDPATPGPTPTCRAYTGFLAEQAAYAPAEVALAAVVPCFRVYAEVGRHLLAGLPAAPSQAHPYAVWIETYADPDFDASVGRVEALADQLAETSPHTDAMLEAYAVATDLEWRFWDQAWHAHP